MEAFIVGRYETGLLSGKAVVVKGNMTIANAKWYAMYKKCKDLKENHVNIETNMLWGCQFDKVLIYLLETGNKSLAEIAVDSSGWGNYYNSTFEYENKDGKIVTKNKNAATGIPTGSTEYTNANNIYDLAGNVWEMTMTAIDNLYRSRRGSSVTALDHTKPVGYRAGAYFPSNSSNSRGGRAGLYIK